MAGTRSSARQASAASSNPDSSENKATPTNGSASTKRKADAGSSPKTKRGKKSNEKEQKTIEETMENMIGNDGEDTPEDVQMKEDIDANGAAIETAIPDLEDGAEHPDQTEENGDSHALKGESSKMDDTGTIESEDTSAAESRKKNTATGDAVEQSSNREASTPSSILEKGIIYFFFRGRVGINEPSDVGDIARSYIVLRPLPHGAKLGDGPIGDAGNNRLLALPKKVLPVSGKDKFMIFVDKANSSMEDIKTNLAASDYVTKTAGDRHTPAATPIGEGVYAITTTGRESHLVYILTIPSELSEVQKDVGLRERGSFVTSVKNPQYPGPANTNLPEGPGFPQEILDEFRSLRWMPLQPKLLNFENTQFLAIGEGVGEIGKATEQQGNDEKQDKDTPLEEMEKLEHEDEIRVQHLKGDDSVFEDLGLSSKEYPKVPSTW